MNIYNFDEIINRRENFSVKWNRYPEGVLPMWVADTDFRPPDPVLAALRQCLDKGELGYPLDLTPQLGEAAAHWMGERFGWEFAQDAVLFAPGVCGALALAISAFTAPGDGILVQTPIYPPFLGLAGKNQRRVLCSALQNGPEGYCIDWPDLEAKLADPGTRLFLFCNPHNPTGRVFAAQELLRLGELCRKHEVLIISDEIHCDFVKPGLQHIPLASLSPELAAITITAINPSKTFNIAGLQTAAVIAANPDLFAQLRAALDRASLWPTLMGVAGFRAAYLHCADYADQVNAYTRGNLEFAVAFIREHIPRVRAYEPEATYLLWLDFRELGLAGQAELETFLLDKAGLALNSGTDYGQEGRGFMRMNLGCPRGLAEDGLLRLAKAVRSI